jgi:hypothetical protein
MWADYEGRRAVFDDAQGELDDDLRLQIYASAPDRPSQIYLPGDTVNLYVDVTDSGGYGLVETMELTITDDNGWSATVVEVGGCGCSVPWPLGSRTGERTVTVRAHLQRVTLTDSMTIVVGSP